MSARRPAVAELGPGRARDAGAGSLGGGGRPAVVDAERNDVEVRFLCRLAADVEVLPEAARRVVRENVGQVVAAINGPVVSGAEEVSELRTVAGLGAQDAALARFFLERP